MGVGYSPLFQRPQYHLRHRRTLIPTAHTLAVWIREDLTTLAGAAVANASGLEVLVWHGVPSSANASPFEVITGVAIATSHIDVQISATGLALFDPITYSLVGPDGNPLLTRFTMRTIIPSYE
jgi:hypothetical protein